MLLCLTGISLSYFLWAFSTNFGIFVLARFAGGISKGNISLSMAIISDVTSAKTRGKAMVKELIGKIREKYLIYQLIVITILFCSRHLWE